jgi:hypothetical protein
MDMRYEDLSKDSQSYIDRCIRNTTKTREQAMQEALVQEVIKEYEGGANRGA